MPDQIREPAACGEFLLELVQRREFEMIVPLGDEVTQIVAERRNAFAARAKLVLVPHDTFMIGRSKIATMKAARECGVPIPKTYDLRETTFDAIDSEASYPLLVKPAFSNGARGITYVHSKDEMVRAFGEISELFGLSFVQELIPHTGLQYKAELLLDTAGNVLAKFAYSKIRFYPTEGGSSTLNQSVDYPEMVEHAVRLARAIGWYGMCDFDFIHDLRDNQPKLMEINPRVTDTIRIAQLCGLDFFGMLYELACNRTVEPVSEYRKGLYMRFLPGEIMWFLKTKQRRFGIKPSFFKFIGGDVKYLVLSASDPGAFWGYLLENISALFDARERAYKLRTPVKSTTNG